MIRLISLLLSFFCSFANGCVTNINGSTALLSFSMMRALLEASIVSTVCLLSRANLVQRPPLDETIVWNQNTSMNPCVCFHALSTPDIGTSPDRRLSRKHQRNGRTSLERRPLLRTCARWPSTARSSE